MKILFFNTNIGYGGASKIMTSVANHMAEDENNEITFLTFRSSEVLQPLSDKVNFVYDELYSHNNKFIEIFGEIKELHKYIKKHKFDICISFLNPASYMLTLAAIGTGTKVILSERGDPNEMANSKNLFIKVIFRIVQHADGYVFQTPQARDVYSQKARSKSVVIPNPIPDKKIPSKYGGERNKEIVTASRMDLYQKRQDVLIDAFAKISPEFPEYVLKLYGDGPDTDKIKEYAEKSGCADKILFMGLSRDVLTDINKSAVFVLSSDFEGIPNALLEAMASGVPSISTDCSPGGARMLIQNEENGLIVPRADSDSLAFAIKRVITDKDFANKISDNAQKVTDTFSKKRILGMWSDYINKFK